MLRCCLKDSEPLKPKGIGNILECSPSEFIHIEVLTQLNPIIDEAIQHIEGFWGEEALAYSFSENEAIGTDYIIYTYRVFKSSDKSYLGSCRVVTHKNLVKSVICTVSSFQR